MSEITPAAAAAAAVDPAIAAAAARAAEPAAKPADQVGGERARIREITKLGRNVQAARGRRSSAAIDAGRTRRRVLSGPSSTTSRAAIRPRSGPSAAKVGMTDREVRRYSIVNAINYLASPTDAKARAAAGFEIEVSEAAADKARTAPKGLMIPADVLSRADFAAGKRAADLTAASATAGSDLIATDLLSGSFIDLLRKKSAILRSNPTMLGGLVGNIAIPRQTGGATAYWVGEDSAPTQSGRGLRSGHDDPENGRGLHRDLAPAAVAVERRCRGPGPPRPRDRDRARDRRSRPQRLGRLRRAGRPEGLRRDDQRGRLRRLGAPTFAEIVAMESAIAADDADVDSMSYIFNATMRGYLKTTPRVSGHPSFIMGKAGRSTATDSLGFQSGGRRRRVARQLGGFRPRHVVGPRPHGRPLHRRAPPARFA